MSMYDHIGGHKKDAKQYKQQLRNTLARVKRIVSSKVDERTLHVLAQGFVVEDNALNLCERGQYQRALSDLSLSGSRDGRQAADALCRLMNEGKMAVPSAV